MDHGKPNYTRHQTAIHQPAEEYGPWANFYHALSGVSLLVLVTSSPLLTSIARVSLLPSDVIITRVFVVVVSYIWICV
ncbi:hypothetical protein DFH29DRAFT_977700 [Suillus ampliporus]|nr:hypothetical protein DFH29DRAFT_977700 [Suillus ampliporus]